MKVGFWSREICADSIDTAIHVEAHDSQWKVGTSNDLEIKCLDEILCSCQNLDVSGFDFQLTAQGHYVKTNSTIDGRKCYILLPDSIFILE